MVECQKIDEAGHGPQTQAAHGFRTLSEFTLFVLVGGFAALVNILARFLFNFGMPFEAAGILAYPVAMMVAFVLNRRWVSATRSTNTRASPSSMSWPSRTSSW